MIGLLGLFTISALTGVVLIFHQGISPVTMAIIGLPMAAAVHTVTDLRETEVMMSEQSSESIDPEVIMVAPNEPNAVKASGWTVYPPLSAISDSVNCDIIETLTGTWTYKHIWKSADPIAELNANDTLFLDRNYQFGYDIASLKKHERGTFTIIHKYEQCALLFAYRDSNTLEITNTRTFDIDYLDSDSLCITEGNLKFTYRRK